MGWLLLAWVLGLLAGGWVVLAGHHGTLHHALNGQWHEPWIGFDAIGFIVLPLGAQCAWLVHRAGEPLPRPPERLNSRDASSALATALVVGALLRWTCLERVAALPVLHAPTEALGVERALLSAVLAGAVGFLALRLAWRPRAATHEVLAALGGTAGVLLLVRGQYRFFYGSIF